MPQVVVDAFLAAEDDRFYKHPGVDWQGLVRALLSNVAAGGVREGGGTITMQLARNTVLTLGAHAAAQAQGSVSRAAPRARVQKQEILTLYLNRIFLGQRAYGVGAAAEVYFDKPLGAARPRGGGADRRAAALAVARQSGRERRTGA